jgi:NCS1 family nucleobase:cation symporter-1
MFKTALVTPAWFALFLWAVIVTKGGGPLVHGPTDINPKVGRPWSALQALNVVIGLFSSLAVNMPDFARFSRSSRASASQTLLLPLIGTLGALSPIFITSAYKEIWGEYQWFLPAVIASFHSRPIKFFTGFAMLIATLGNQIAAGSFPFGNDISGIFPQYVNIRRAAVLMSIFCLISCPWDIIANAAALLSFLSGYSCFMGPLAGVMCSDYYLVRKGKLNVKDLYNPNGLYRYNRGWNWRAFVAFFVPVSVLVPGLAYSIAPLKVKVNDGILHLYCKSSFFWPRWLAHAKLHPV